MSNLDRPTAEAFDSIWSRQAGVCPGEAGEDSRKAFEAFFSIFPLEELGDGEGFELGCGGGRIAQFVAPEVRLLHCIDQSSAAIKAAQAAMWDMDTVCFHRAPVDAIPLADGSQDFGYSLGVLHHIPDPQAGLDCCVAKLKPGAPFLLYLYYAFDQRPAWFRFIWRASDIGRQGISRLPFAIRRTASDLIAGAVYWPLSRLAGLLERSGRNVSNVPLSMYRDRSWATLRADSLDRFGTPVEHRFTRDQMEALMLAAGLTSIRFRDGAPYWVAVGWKA